MAGGRLVLGIDQGTHASRAILFDGTGRALARGVSEVRLHRPRPGWAEHGEGLVESVFRAIAAALRAAGHPPVAAAGLACQRANCAVWDRETGDLLSPIFSWQDRRATAIVERLAEVGPEIRRRTGLFLSAHYGAAKFAWAATHLPAVTDRERAPALGPMSSLLVQRLTRERHFMADPHTAARTQLLSLDTRDWDIDLLATFRLPKCTVPSVAPTCHDYGTLDPGIPLVALNGDQAAALFAAGEPDPGVAWVNAGTGAFVQRVLDRRPAGAERLLESVVLDDLEGETLWTLEGTANGAGSALGDVDRTRLPAWLEAVADPPLFLNGVAGLGSPFWVPDFESRFVGEGGEAERAVAVVESIAFLLRANLDEMEKALPPPREIRLSGGLSRLAGFGRVLAEVTGLPVLRHDDPEATARGIAYLAAGRPEGWGAGGGGRRIVPAGDRALRDRYERWREILRKETGR